MKRPPITLALCALTILAAPALAAPGGEIGTLEIGHYVCELPGDATRAAGIRVPEQDFSIVTASGYVVDGVRGNYLLTGDTMVMTSGPRRGERYRRVSDRFVRLIAADGSQSLRCVRGNANNR